ncbi:hypothetical protein ACFV9D_13085 [Streptomyces sp. NPDC059875]|uniref:hypothetical protein n=1 Tax=unclassified Streptomyces TaxID=2593676 RepID=UPI00365F1BC6
MTTTPASQATAAPSTTTASQATAAPTTTPDPTAPSVRALRILAFGGLLALFVSLVLTGIVALDDAIGGDGKSGGAVAAAFWALGLGALAGLTAAVTPRAALAYRVRTCAVALQYTLAVIAPVIAMMD